MRDSATFSSKISPADDRTTSQSYPHGLFACWKFRDGWRNPSKILGLDSLKKASFVLRRVLRIIAANKQGPLPSCWPEIYRLRLAHVRHCWGNKGLWHGVLGLGIGVGLGTLIDRIPTLIWRHGSWTSDCNGPSSQSSNSGLRHKHGL